MQMEGGTITFRKFNGEVLENVEEYVKNYCLEHKNNIDIIVATDSQNKGSKTTYSTVIGMYDRGDGEHGHGAHCIFRRWKTDRERVRNTRLLNEVGASIEIAQKLVSAGCPKPKFIDIDINPNPKFKSNEVYSAAKGWAEGLGYEVRFKHLGPMFTYVADWLVKA